MATELRELIATASYSDQQISERSSQIHTGILRDSASLDAANFNLVDSDDLASLFDRYDQLFFDQTCKRRLDELPASISFRVSSRMTRAGGRTTRTGSPGQAPLTFEIAVSSTLLFRTFADVQRPIAVAGITCNSRLEAMQRIFEHELIHLIEFLVWDNSSCAGARFQDLARRFFGHNGVVHDLITPQETAMKKYGIRRGDRVAFRFENIDYAGVVNRITHRATVLVEDKHGREYRDGRRYAKFYVPLDMITRVSEQQMGVPGPKPGS